MGYPDWDGCINDQWGWPDEVSCSIWGGALNIAVGTNPSYAYNDFLAMYPKFFGTAVSIKGDLTTGLPTVSNISSMTGLAVGQLVTGVGIPNGTVILSLGTNAITMSQNATATGLQSSFSVYTTPPMPLPVISAYITLASASLMQARWCEMWTLAMALYIAHFCTLYLRSEGNPGSTPAQIALSGIEKGLEVSKSVGPVSVSKQMLEGFEDWGAFRETSYGMQLITFGKAIGSGPMLVY